MMEESAFRVDDNGTIKIGEGSFLRHVNQDELEPHQMLVGKQVMEAMRKQFPINVVKSSRRMSISMKGKSDCEEDNKEPKQNNHSKKGRKSPKNKWRAF